MKLNEIKFTDLLLLYLEILILSLKLINIFDFFIHDLLFLYFSELLDWLSELEAEILLEFESEKFELLIFDLSDLFFDRESVFDDDEFLLCEILLLVEKLFID